jgi:hypothetical protein
VWLQFVGSKRLVSMPDRVTNTVRRLLPPTDRSRRAVSGARAVCDARFVMPGWWQVADASGISLTRPSPISAYQGDIGTVEKWFPPTSPPPPLPSPPLPSPPHKKFLCALRSLSCCPRAMP